MNRSEHINRLIENGYSREKAVMLFDNARNTAAIIHIKTGNVTDETVTALIDTICQLTR
jgi:hypothetical protein